MGVQAGHAAGIFTVAVNTGPLDPQVLHDAGADIVLSGMTELAERFDEILALQQQLCADDIGHQDHDGTDDDSLRRVASHL